MFSFSFFICLVVEKGHTLSRVRANKRKFYHKIFNAIVGYHLQIKVYESIFLSEILGNWIQKISHLDFYWTAMLQNLFLLVFIHFFG
jgi:hypothetical protein